MDPLARVREAHERGDIPEKTYGLVKDRFPLAVAGIDRIEKASGMRFPAAYVEPSAMLASAHAGFGYGILFARTIPVVHDGSVVVLIQVSAPLVAYGLKGTIHAVLAHEFLHYLELARRASRMEVVSDEVTGSLFESAFADQERLLEPRAVFSDKTLVDHITKRFPEGFRDTRLEKKVESLWISRGLPRTVVDIDTNTARIPAGAMSNMKLDDGIAAKIAEIERKSRKKRRQIY